MIVDLVQQMFKQTTQRYSQQDRHQTMKILLTKLIQVNVSNKVSIDVSISYADFNENYVYVLKVGGNSYYRIPFPNENMAHSLNSLTHLLTQKGWGKTIITVVCPKQKIVVFINFYNFNFVVFSLLIQHYRSSPFRGVPMIRYSEICSKSPGEHQR